ncbi:MAG: hypothetical protein H6943_04035 [Zoogloeaceae bacterium]|nr:hypothetical protein [Zoogloeaceae bacterium]
MIGIAEALVHSASLIWLVPALPLAAALLIGGRMLQGVSGDDAEPVTAALARGAALGSGLLLLVFLLAALLAGAPGHLLLGNWFAVPGFSVPVSFLLDQTALLVAAVVAFIAWVTISFSTAYLHREPRFHRFHFGMSLFLGGMLLIVLAGNAVLGFVGWELCGLASWLLIAYADERPRATGNALFAFLCNRVGDAGFLLAIGLGFWWLGSVEWPVLLGGTLAETVKLRMLLLGLLVAALAKSAQLPFTPWITRALEGPTPSSAVFYGAVMVHAGVYLLIRINPLLQQVPDMAVAVAVAGLATALYGWLCGRVSSDVKTSLVLATVVQVGLMVFACGMGWTEMATGHLLLHAVWRAYQFLLAPSYLVLAPKPLPLSRWLAGNGQLYTAALQRFWIEPLIAALLQRPTLLLGQDVRKLDERVLERLVGAPDLQQAAAATEGGGSAGVGGRLLGWLATHFQRLESRLVFQNERGGLVGVLQRLGEMIRMLEHLLEQPRYLMLMVMATFVVIL